MDQKETIVTHDGRFHGDEVVAYSILHELFPKYELIRTRKEDIIRSGTIVIDVGSIYDPDKLRFDHHQEDCNLTFGNDYTIPMSSAGMIYKHYGKQYLASILNKEISDISEGFINDIYKNIFLAIDAHDNGIRHYIKKMLFHPLDISTSIAKMNYTNTNKRDQQLIQFMTAARIMSELIKEIIISDFNKHQLLKSDYDLITISMKSRHTNDKSNNILVISAPCINWRFCLRLYEKTMDIPYNNRIKFIIYKANDGKSSDDKIPNWKIRGISKNNKFGNFILPKNQLIKQMINPNNLTFVHKSLFIAGSKDVDSAIDIAQLSL